jgi:hypothetical protein
MRIERPDKNRMRRNLEEIQLLQKELEYRLDEFLQVEPVEDYRHFWQKLRDQYRQNILNTSDYMVRKCNR